jgi:hypothetical protein
MEKTRLKYFQEVKANTEKDLDKAVKVSASQSEIDRLLKENGLFITIHSRRMNSGKNKLYSEQIAIGKQMMVDAGIPTS